jgi:hypothetical protein
MGSLLDSQKPIFIRTNCQLVSRCTELVVTAQTDLVNVSSSETESGEHLTHS